MRHVNAFRRLYQRFLLGSVRPGGMRGGSRCGKDLVSGRRPGRIIGILIAVIWILAGCQSRGPATVTGDAFDYSAAIARSRTDQMLLNIVRLRYMQVPNFLTVSSVITSYTYQGGVGVQGQAALGTFDEDFINGSANLGYVERPTVTYSPLQGEAFSRRLMQKIPVEVLFALSQAGWPGDVLLRIAVESFGDAQNLTFATNSMLQDGGTQRDNLLQYDRAVSLATELDSAGALEVVEDPSDRREIMRFHESLSPETSSRAAELRRLLGIHPTRLEFTITDRRTGRQEDDIVIRTRSLLAVLNFLGFGIDLPASDVESGHVVAPPDFVWEAIVRRGPIRIRSSEEAPVDAYAAIQFRNHWFYIEADDHLSKRTFIATMVLFELLAPGEGGAAPLLSLPAG